MKWDDWAIVAEVSRHRIRLDLPVCGLDQQWPPSEVCMNTVLYPFSILQSAAVCVLLPSVPDRILANIVFSRTKPRLSSFGRYAFLLNRVSFPQLTSHDSLMMR